MYCHCGCERCGIMDCATYINKYAHCIEHVYIHFQLFHRHSPSTDFLQRTHTHTHIHTQSIHSWCKCIQSPTPTLARSHTGQTAHFLAGIASSEPTFWVSLVRLFILVPAVVFFTFHPITCMSNPHDHRVSSLPQATHVTIRLNDWSVRDASEVEYKDKAENDNNYR